MATIVEHKTTAQRLPVAAWLPLAVLPGAVLLVGSAWPPWVVMWVLAGSIYAGAKWLTFAACPTARTAPLGRSLGYLLLWPGMDASGFLTVKNPGTRPQSSEWWLVAGKVLFGLWLILAAAPLAIERSALLAGWLGMAGLVFVLHFGLFHLLSVLWRAAAVDAPRIMQAPARAGSLAEFWGQRWNLAFRDLAHGYLFRPLLPVLGPMWAMLAVFLVSGLVHDLVISVPAGAGYGLPTLYFVIQGFGLLLERSPVGKRLGLGRAVPGRLFCAAVTIAPAWMLFHGPFVERVILPMLHAIGAV